MGGWGGRERGAEGAGYLPGRGVRGVGGGVLGGVLVGKRFLSEIYSFTYSLFISHNVITRHVVLNANGSIQIWKHGKEASSLLLSAPPSLSSPPSLQDCLLTHSLMAFSTGKQLYICSTPPISPWINTELGEKEREGIKFLFVEEGSLEADEEQISSSLSRLPSPVTCLSPIPLSPCQSDRGEEGYIVVVGCMDGWVRGVEFGTGKVAFEKWLSSLPPSPSSPSPTCVKVAGREQGVELVVGFIDGQILGGFVEGFFPREDLHSLSSLSSSLSSLSSPVPSSPLPSLPSPSVHSSVWGCNVTYPSPVRNLVLKIGNGGEDCVVASHAGISFFFSLSSLIFSFFLLI